MIVPQETFLILKIVWTGLSGWWWLIVPPVLLFAIRDLWLMYKRSEFIFYKMEWILLEIRLPQVVERTAQAMEQVFAGFHAMYSGPEWYERYRDGKVAPWASCEIVSLGGETHFYIRVLSKFRNLVEVNVWAQYPDAEIHEVDDYVDSIPRDIPNDTWDIWGADIKLKKSDPYPIRTYEDFEDITEERRLDPLASMLEVMSSINPGEQLWFQILAQPVFGDWEKDGMAEVNKIMGIKPPPKKKLTDLPVIGEVIKIFQDFAIELLGIVSPTGAGEASATSADKKDDSRAAMVTPGQKDVIKAIERNVSKLGFKVNMRFAYVGKKEIYNRSRIPEFFGALRQFNSENLNSMVSNSQTTPDIEMRPFSSQRNYRRKRLLDRHYRYRLFRGTHFIFNTEELATIFHFPGMSVANAPALSRIEAKKGEPPAALPEA